MTSVPEDGGVTFMTGNANERLAVDAGTGLQSEIERHWPGTTEAECWTASIV
jgi:hypothetical protein